MDEHLKVLQLAVDNQLPNSIDCNSDISVVVLRDLIENNYIRAINTSSKDGRSYLEPEITLPGRSFLVFEKKKKLKKNPKQIQSKISVRRRVLYYFVKRLDMIVVSVLSSAASAVVIYFLLEAK